MPTFKLFQENINNFLSLEIDPKLAEINHTRITIEYALS